MQQDFQHFSQQYKQIIYPGSKEEIFILTYSLKKEEFRNSTYELLCLAKLYIGSTYVLTSVPIVSARNPATTAVTRTANHNRIVDRVLSLFFSAEYIIKQDTAKDII